MSIPEVLISDHSSQYSSSEFKEFAKEWGFEHRTSSPGYPQSNGLAEKGVGIAKKLMQKAKDTNTNIYISLLEYRNTPLECGYTPSQLLIGRRTKSIVPITNKALLPTLVNAKKVRNSMDKSKDKQKANYNKTAKYLPPLSLNQLVRVKLGKTWKRAKITKVISDRSYLVQLSDGSVYRRNRSVLHKSPEDTIDIEPFNAQVLESKSPQLPQEENDFSPETNDLPINSRSRTRAGRLLRGNSKYDSNEWVK